ncbi:unnamed protein product [Diabrotica balteata]|uniref:Uncharacterized protein n=1 Tax=Diabrotica balteata TaxID=107213 RepID=A0A9N9X7U8_DIABA|nr:unnamed protein product [Diabrotica balteata]
MADVNMSSEASEPFGSDFSDIDSNYNPSSSNIESSDENNDDSSEKNSINGLSNTKKQDNDESEGKSHQLSKKIVRNLENHAWYKRKIAMEKGEEYVTEEEKRKNAKKLVVGPCSCKIKCHMKILNERNLRRSKTRVYSLPDENGCDQVVGKYSAVAKNYEAMSELLQEDYNNQEAEKYLEQAAYFYQLDKRYWASNKCLEQIAEGAALASDYVKAIKIFEGIACFELSSSTRKHVANEYFFRCAICVLCAGASVTKRLLTYIYIFPPFKMSREYELVVCLAECINDNDLEGFEYAVRIFDSQTELSQWHVTLLLRARNQITEKEHLIL